MRIVKDDVHLEPRCSDDIAALKVPHDPDDGVLNAVFFFSSRRRHTRWTGDWSSDVCSSDLNTRVTVATYQNAQLSNPSGQRSRRCNPAASVETSSRG